MANKPIKDYSGLKVKEVPCPMRFVEGGTLDLGEGESKHSVTIPSFHMGQYQVTQALYEAIMETNPSRFKGKNHPVTNVNWHKAKTFIEKLNMVTGKEFRLPSESEWEFAAMGGVNSQGYEYCGSDDLKQVGWYRENSGGETKPVGLLLPNELGLYDMSGNVYEWCEDDYHGDFKDAPKDGSAWKDGTTAASMATDRVIRGGTFFYGAGGCRAALRNGGGDRDDFIGFRLVLSLQS